MIESIKDLEKLLKLCRKQGVTEIEVSGAKFKLGDLPEEQKTVSFHESVNPLEGFPDGELSPEQLAFYSAGGLPENDPYLNHEAN